MNYIERAQPYSKSSAERLWATWHACKEADHNNIPGVLVECGVWRGGNVMVMRWASPSRQCWVYDTFAGMTEPGEYDGAKANKHFKNRGAKLAKGNKNAMVSLVEVQGNFIREGIDLSLMAFVVGDVRETLKPNRYAHLPDQIAVLRLDTDFYDSTKIEIETLYPRLSVGGYLIVDDYGHWPGARKAVDEYLGDKKFRLRHIDYTGAWMVKP